MTFTDSDDDDVTDVGLNLARKVDGYQTGDAVKSEGTDDSTDTDQSISELDEVKSKQPEDMVTTSDNKLQSVEKEVKVDEKLQPVDIATITDVELQPVEQMIIVEGKVQPVEITANVDEKLQP